MGTSNAGTSNTEPFGPGGGADWLFEGARNVDPTTGQFTDDAYYPADFFTETVGLKPSDHQTGTSGLETANPDGSVYSSGEPPATNAEVSTIAQQNNETVESQPWDDTFVPSESGHAPGIPDATSAGVQRHEENSNRRCPPTHACDQCAKKKLGCSGQIPCNRCVEGGVMWSCTRSDRYRPYQAPNPLEPKMRKSCEGCREAKWGCNQEKPCKRCSERGLDCVYKERAKRAERSKEPAGQHEGESVTAEESSDDDLVPWD